MGNNNTQVTKRRVAISFFLFMIIFLMFLTTLPGFYNIEYLSTPMMIVGKFTIGFLCLLLVAYNGASFIYKLLSYFECLKNKGSD
ncbi:hypothetical protein [Escherichia coli]|uniref:hypothetical protein n=1 Tax=Escherichia coli TaxID=562 RepID=UPI003890E8EB